MRRPRLSGRVADAKSSSKSLQLDQPRPFRSDDGDKTDNGGNHRGFAVSRAEQDSRDDNAEQRPRKLETQRVQKAQEVAMAQFFLAHTQTLG